MSTLADTATGLRDAMTAYAKACAATTKGDWVRQGPPRGWSMAETTEHVATTNMGIRRIVGALRPLEQGQSIALNDREINVGMFRGDGAPPGLCCTRLAENDAECSPDRPPNYYTCTPCSSEVVDCEPLAGECIVYLGGSMRADYCCP